MKKFYEIISWVFNPLNFPIIGSVFYFNYCNQTTDLTQKISVYVLVAITTIIAPIIYLVYKKKKNDIQDLFVTERKDRKGPLNFSILLSFITFFTLSILFNLWQFGLLFVSSAIALGVALILLRTKTKVSVHMIGVGNALGFIWVIYNNCLNLAYHWVLVFFIISILVGLARVALKAHTIKETLIGFVAGLFSCVLIFYFIPLYNI